MERILFTGESDFNELVKGIDGMTDALKRAQVQGNVSNETLVKMEGAVEGVKSAVSNLHSVTGKGIAPSFNDGRIVQQLDNVKKGVEQMTDTVSKKTQEARDKLNSLEKANATLKDEIKSINAVLRENEKEYKAAEKALQKLIDSQKGGSREALALREQLKGIRNNSSEMRVEMAKTQTQLVATTTQIKAQKAAVREAESAGNGFTASLNKIWSGLSKVSYLIPGLGIAGLVSLVAGPLITAFTEWAKSVTESEKSLKLMNEAIAGSGGAYQKAHSEVSLLRIEIDLAKKGFMDKDEVVKNFNDTIGKTVGQVNSLEEAEKSLNANADNYIKMTLYKAAATLALDEAAKVAFESMQRQRRAEDLQRKLLSKQESEADKAAGTGGLSAFAASGTKMRAAAALAEAEAEQKAFEEIAAKFLTDAAKASANFTPGSPVVSAAKKSAKEITNIYLQELQKLQSDLANVAEKGFTNEATITAAIEADFKKRDLAFQKAFKNKQLTAGQLSSLQENLKNLQQLTLDKSLKDFGEQKAEYLQKINDQLEQLQSDADLKRIANIQDSFERERQTILAESEKSAIAYAQRRDKTIAEITKGASVNGLRPEEIEQIEQIKRTYATLLDELEIAKNQRLQKLSFDTFQKLANDAKDSFDRAGLNITRASLGDIQAQTDLYLAGKISYETYQKELTRIASEEADKRYFKEVENIRKQIRLRENQLVVNSGNLTDDQKEQLEKEVTRLQQQLANLERGQLKGDATAPDNKLQQLLAYANAIKSVTDNVISFWQQANDAEQRSMERSIVLQDRRVEAARNVAAKGNADYLRMEEEKQQQLLIRQENAARRQMAINAALQASQMLVAVTGAIAKIATPGVGAVDVIASIGVIIGSLAAGYALVKSLQSNQPSFFVGTEDTGPGGKADEKGGFHAVLHPHERVLTAEENKQLKGLSNKQLVEMVQKSRVFVEQWKSKPVPGLNVAAMEMAGSTNDRVAAIMEENNRELKLNNMLQLKTHRLLKGMGVSVNFDKNGVAVMVMEAADEVVKSKKI